MAVYDRSYKRYEGPITPQSIRFLVLPRYAIRDVFKSRLLVFFYALCFIVPLGLAVRIYIQNYVDLPEALLDMGWGDLIAINTGSFFRFLIFQGFLATAITIFVGPGLVARDLSNNGLPLYLSRPISRGEYILGKFFVLLALLSALTWLPGFMLFALQGYLAPGDWWRENIRALPGLFFGAILLIVFLGLLSLAFSAWVKWRPVAAFLILTVPSVAIFFAFIMNELFFRGGTRDWGHLINPIWLIWIAWANLFGLEPPDGPPLIMTWLALGTMSAFLLFVLYRKLRAYEVVS